MYWNQRFSVAIQKRRNLFIESITIKFCTCSCPGDNFGILDQRRLIFSIKSFSLPTYDLNKPNRNKIKRNFGFAITSFSNKHTWCITVETEFSNRKILTSLNTWPQYYAFHFWALFRYSCDRIDGKRVLFGNFQEYANICFHKLRMVW